MIDQNNKIIFSVIIIIYLILGFISVRNNNIQIDEAESHIPTVRTFYYETFFTALTGDLYKSANTPLPYILNSEIHKLFNRTPDLSGVRLINVIISFITLITFYVLLKRNSISAFPFLFIFLFYPYFIKPSFVFYMAGYGLLFFLCFLIFVEREGYINQILGAVSLSLAVLSQQFYLVLLAPLIIYKLIAFTTIDYKKGLAVVFIWLVSFIPVALLFYLWGGLTHPNYRLWGIEIHVEYLSAILVVLGSVLWPFLIPKLKEIDHRIFFLFLITGLIIAIYIFPAWVKQPTPGGIAGYTFHLLAIISGYNFTIGIIIKTLLILSGLFVVFFIIHGIDGSDLLLKTVFIFFLLGFMLNKLPSERHLLPLLVTAMLLVFKSADKKTAVYLWLPYQILAGLTYFSYLMWG